MRTSLLTAVYTRVCLSVLLTIWFDYIPVLAQTITASTITASPGDDFSYDGQTTPHYGIKYTVDSWRSTGLTSWMSGWGGIKFFTLGTKRLSLDASGLMDFSGPSFLVTSGNIGVGTSTPYAKLHIQNTGSSLGMLIDGNNSSYVGSDLSISRANTAGGVGQSPTIQFNDGNDAAQIIQGSKNNGLQFFKFFYELGVWKETMRIASNGNLGVGTTTPPLNYKLAVAGKIIAEELKIQSQSAWPDYVFKPTYKLTPLPDLEQFIKTHQHLPEIPSAKEVAANGIEVGANQALLLKKIEEITLHLIELNKKVEELQQENQALKKSKRKRFLW